MKKTNSTKLEKYIVMDLSDISVRSFTMIRLNKVIKETAKSYFCLACKPKNLTAQIRVPKNHEFIDLLIEDARSREDASKKLWQKIIENSILLKDEIVDSLTRPERLKDALFTVMRLDRLVDHILWDRHTNFKNINTLALRLSRCLDAWHNLTTDFRYSSEENKSLREELEKFLNGYTKKPFKKYIKDSTFDYRAYILDVIRDTLNNCKDVISVPFKQIKSNYIGCGEIEDNVLYINTLSETLLPIKRYGGKLFMKNSERDREIYEISADDPNLLSSAQFRYSKRVVIHVGKPVFEKLEERLISEPYVTKDVLDKVVAFSVSQSNGSLVLDTENQSCLEDIIPSEISRLFCRLSARYNHGIEVYGKLTHKRVDEFFNEVNLSDFFIKINLFNVSEFYISKKHLYDIFVFGTVLCYNNESGGQILISPDGVSDDDARSDDEIFRCCPNKLEEIIHNALKKQLPEEADGWLLMSRMKRNEENL